MSVMQEGGSSIKLRHDKIVWFFAYQPRLDLLSCFSKHRMVHRLASLVAGAFDAWGSCSDPVDMLHLQSADVFLRVATVDGEKQREP